MYLVYKSGDGEHHYQHYSDLSACGTLIDPETGDDLEIVGWCPAKPQETEMPATISTEPMTQEAYVAAQGLKCPFCGADDIEGGGLNVEGGSCSQEVWCRVCGGGGCYTLMGYTPL